MSTRIVISTPSPHCTSPSDITIGFLELFYIGVEADLSVILQVGVSGILGVPINAQPVTFNPDTADGKLISGPWLQVRMTVS